MKPTENKIFLSHNFFHQSGTLSICCCGNTNVTLDVPCGSDGFVLTWSIINHHNIFCSQIWECSTFKRPFSILFLSYPPDAAPSWPISTLGEKKSQGAKSGEHWGLGINRIWFFLWNFCVESARWLGVLSGWSANRFSAHNLASSFGYKFSISRALRYRKQRLHFSYMAPILPSPPCGCQKIKLTSISTRTEPCKLFCVVICRSTFTALTAALWMDHIPKPTIHHLWWSIQEASDPFGYHSKMFLQ